MKQKILLNKAKGKLMNDSNTIIKSTIDSDSRLLPIGECERVIDEYKQYLKEKKASNKYRLSFSINPICSNILFNNVSEIIYKEGSNDCVVFNSTGATNSSITGQCQEYIKYKYGKNGINYKNLNRREMLRDTSYSHPSILDVTYHCGYDIFNNHILRQKEPININILEKEISENTEYTKYFNTLFDYKRYNNGKIVDEKINYDDKDPKELHTYLIDTVYNFENSINENLIEKDGWIGFTNKTLIDIPNFGDISLNKCLNNREACEFIDMYPDRSLFSFTPKINKYRGNRIENNWDYCLTYPFENFEDNDIVRYKFEGENEEENFTINGLKANLITDYDFGEDYDEDVILTFSTDIKNNFFKGSLVNFVIIGKLYGDSDSSDTTTDVSGSTIEVLDITTDVIGNGYNGRDEERYFSVRGGEIIELLDKFKEIHEFRVRRSAGEYLCRYYFRKFRRIPNFNNTNALIDGAISDDEIKTYSNRNFNSCNNSLGFAKNIYSDGISQILFNDDINLGLLKDNLGRKVSEIFLTIVKNNKGNVEWYDNKDYRNSAVTFSHCFSKVTSGIDIKDNEIKDYNIHSIHNTPTGVTTITACTFYQNIFIDEKEDKNYRVPNVLEDDIDIHGVNGSNEFLGDIVELSPGMAKEFILEDVYHRFNTRQREYWKNGDNEYANLFKDEIFSDDFDLDVTFQSYDSKVSEGYKYNTYYEVKDNAIKEMNSKTIPVNIAPEGYYYKPHYSIKLREYKNTVKEGQHTLVVINDKFTAVTDNIFNITTNKNYFLENGKELYLYNRVTNEKKHAIISNVGGKNFVNATIEILENGLNSGETLSDYRIFKPNSEKPEYAYEIEDGYGKYVWRDELEEYELNGDIINDYVFTNGAHYINKDIVFFLRRQDPIGYYNLSNANNESPLAQNLTIDGYGKDYSSEEYLENEEGMLC